MGYHVSTIQLQGYVDLYYRVNMDATAITLRNMFIANGWGVNNVVLVDSNALTGWAVYNVEAVVADGDNENRVLTNLRLLADEIMEVTSATSNAVTAPQPNIVSTNDGTAGWNNFWQGLGISTAPTIGTIALIAAAYFILTNKK